MRMAPPLIVPFDLPETRLWCFDQFLLLCNALAPEGNLIWRGKKEFWGRSKSTDFEKNDNNYKADHKVGLYLYHGRKVKIKKKDKDKSKDEGKDKDKQKDKECIKLTTKLVSASIREGR